MLRKVTLNHAIAQGNQSRAMMLVLGLGVISICLVLYQLRSLNIQKQTLETKIESLQHPQVSRSAKPFSASQLTGKREEMAAVDSVIKDLALPWESLFATLENINSQNTAAPEIRLLSVEPNPRQHKLRLTAESTSVDAMLDYVRVLSQQPMLKEVLLQTHEQSHDGRAMPISFVVEAIWQL